MTEVYYIFTQEDLERLSHALKNWNGKIIMGVSNKLFWILAEMGLTLLIMIEVYCKTTFLFDTKVHPVCI